MRLATLIKLKSAIVGCDSHYVEITQGDVQVFVVVVDCSLMPLRGTAYHSRYAVAAIGYGGKGYDMLILLLRGCVSDNEWNVNRYGRVCDEGKEILEIVAVLRYLEVPSQAFGYLTAVGERRAGELVAILHRLVATGAFHCDIEYPILG